MPNDPADQKTTEPTPDQIKTFMRAATMLNNLGKAGLHLYMAPGSLCLMSGPSHDGMGSARQGRIKAEHQITRGSGGDW